MTTATPVYRCTFDRIGRNHNVGPQDFAARSADELATVVWNFARPYLASRDVEVSADLEKGEGLIFVGFHVGGRFTIEPVAA